MTELGIEGQNMIDSRLEEKMMNDLTNVIINTDWQEITNLIKKLQEENQRLKVMINGFLNGVEKDKNAKEVKIFHVCKYTSLLNEYQRWLEKEKEEKYRDCGITQKAITKCYEKLIELRKKYEESNIK